MPEIFAHIIILFVHLDGSWHIWQMIKTLAIAPGGFLLSVVLMSYGSRTAITVGSTSGCSVFVMHCLLPALILLFNMESRRRNHRDPTDAERKKEGKTMSWNVSILKNYFATFLLCCLCLSGLLSSKSMQVSVCTVRIPSLFAWLTIYIDTHLDINWQYRST